MIYNFRKNLRFRLSDKILLIVVSLATLTFVFAKFVLGGGLFEITLLGAITYATSFVFTYILSNDFSRRIVELTFRVEEMAAGNFSYKFAVKDKDEIGQLTHALNDLISRLQTGVAQDVSKHLELSQAKTDFVTIASHQLRTPLSIIKWYVDFLVSGDAGVINVDQEKYLREVYNSNERLINLVNALLDVSRIDLGTFAIEPEPTDIIERASGALESFLPEIEKKKIKLKKHFDEFGKINLDPRLIKIVFENIISNAVKYTPEGGIIDFRIKKTEKDIYIKISDTGCGIPREEQPKMFTKLFRGYDAKKIESSGTGLGLYVVKAVIEKSGGKIWFESPSLDLLIKEQQKNYEIPLDKRNRGTTFNITIPLKGMKPKLGTKKLTSIS